MEMRGDGLPCHDRGLQLDVNSQINLRTDGLTDSGPGRERQKS